ncbi:MAG: hypothetical protein WCD67_23125, partial [Xanthobacteraceae bacterium]
MSAAFCKLDLGSAVVIRVHARASTASTSLFCDGCAAAAGIPAATPSDVVKRMSFVCVGGRVSLQAERVRLKGARMHADKLTYVLSIAWQAKSANQPRRAVDAICRDDGIYGQKW